MAFIDSSKLQVCHNLRICRYQVLKVLQREKKARGGDSTA
ncbi:transposase [Candidatus Enterovibrio escicola]